MRVLVAMSGGVDSSVAAARLLAQGHDVTGVTLKLWGGESDSGCCSVSDVEDARRVAAQLGIPHYTFNFADDFSAAVVGPYVDAHAAGLTPNPCVECNRSIKFRDLLETARELGADVLATGHYVASRALPDGRRALHRAADPDRDQSYFLYATTPEQLDLLRFPLGELPKEKTRELAREFGLTVAEKADSQDICFVTQGRYSDVIERLKPGAVHGGEIVHVDGRVLGRHEGIIHYTVGQRKGLGLSVGEPLYVIRLDAKEARVVVGPREALATRLIRVTDVNWLGDVPLKSLSEKGMEVAVRVRSTRQPRPALLRSTGTHTTVELLSAEDGVSPGQACVIYESDAPRSRVLGGGTIARTVAEAAPAAA